MSRILDNKEDFYELLNSRVTNEYKIMTDLNAPKHHLVVKPQQGTLVLNDDSQQQNYEQRLMNKQQEIVKKRMK